MKTHFATSTILALAAVSVQATTIYQDNFDGTSATDLDGLAPDVRPGSETWVASSLFDADGAVASGSGSATLAFIPTDDGTYTLDASLTNTGTSWIAVGFANGQNNLSGTNFRFTTSGTDPSSGTDKVGGRAWTLFQKANGVRKTFTTNTTDDSEWVGLTGDLGDSIDIQIVLTDTQAGAGTTWSATYYAKLPASGSYTQVGGPKAIDNDITSVGFAVTSGGSGSVTSFALTGNVVPEPTSLALLGLGGLCVLRRRRV